MFTGIIQAIGRIRGVEERRAGLWLSVGSGGLPTAGWRSGDSIAVAGVCLTATAIDGEGFEAIVSGETLAHTTLGRLRAGSAVNLEPALRAGDALGGHHVSGHVDGVALVRSVEADGGSLRLACEAPAALARFLARKGSVTLDGVSLTVNEADGARFGVNLVPHTREATTLGGVAAGDGLNLEVDLVARYLDRLMRAE